jgi:ribose transport system substrate-binding protein
MKKRLITAVALLACALLSAGCHKNAAERAGETGGTGARKRTIVFVNPIVGHPVYNQQDEAFKQAAKDYGVTPIIAGPAAVDPEAMVREIENAIAEKVDGIVTVPFNWAVFENVFKRAKEAGIQVVVTGNDTPPEWRLGFIGTDNKAYGERAAEILAQKTGGKANIVIMMSQLDVQNQVEQRQAFEQTIKAYPQMHIVTVESDKADMSLALQKFEEIFRAHPEIDTVLELEATGGVAAAQAAREAGIADKITILAIDDLKETLDAIRNGSIWGTLAQNFRKMGYESVGMIVDHLDGMPITPVVDSGLVLITKANLDTYKQEMDAGIRRKTSPPTATPAH